MGVKSHPTKKKKKKACFILPPGSSGFLLCLPFYSEDNVSLQKFGLSEKYAELQHRRP
jgi:hypothetical protein